jgi:N-acetylmuramoyl-L-alanine amidase
MRLTGRDIDRRDRLHGYSKCGYHYVIQRDGVVYQGRQDREPSIHDDNDAKAAISVCLVGGVDDFDTPSNNFTLPQLDSLRTLIRVHDPCGDTLVKIKTPAYTHSDLNTLMLTR